VLPAFVALESDLDFEAPYHGARGPLPVSRELESKWGIVSHAVRDAAGGLGHAFSADVNAPASTGVSPVAWNRRDGIRVSTNDAFLDGARSRPNLKIVGNTVAERLIVSGGRVTGATLRTPEGPLTVEADEVIVCAGAIHSPTLLLRSGIGDGDELRKHGLSVVAHVPGVGTNLQDHPMVCLKLPLAESARGGAPALPTSCVLRFARDGHAAQPNEIQIMPLERIPFEPHIVQAGFLISYLRPSSTGSVRLASADPSVGPLVDFRMLSDEDDVTALCQALRHAGELTRRAPLARVLESGLFLGPDLPLAAVDDDALRQWLRAACIPHFHAVGTCRMGASSDAGAVVDVRGRVRGVEGLRVVDASIMPDLPTAPTHMTTVMLAQHIADQEQWSA
jgi:choline dehydrogenase-like flavoprotein